MASSSKAAPASFLQRLKTVDWDRYFCTLFAPADAREDLALLYLFNHELARAREVASEPMLAMIRLRWWEEVVEGAARRHDIAAPLLAAIDRGSFAAPDLMGLIEARRVECEPEIPDEAAFLSYARGTAGVLARIAGRRLGADSGVIEDLGTAYGIAGLIRAAPYHRAHGRVLLPADGTKVDVLAAAAVALLRVPPPRTGRAAALPGAWVRRDLLRRAPAPRGLGDRLAVVQAALTGRL